MLATCMYMQHLDLLFATSKQIICNIHLEQMKHLEYTRETYMYIAIRTCATSRSTFVTSIYNTCNIPRKHLKHTIVTCAFSISSAYCLDKCRLIDAELDTSTELESAEWCGGHRCGVCWQHGPRQGQRAGGWSTTVTGGASLGASRASARRGRSSVGECEVRSDGRTPYYKMGGTSI
jgi:hypothetical protein